MAKVVFVVLSLEGPDEYSHAGGLGSRISGLSSALASLGHETHLFFIGDPDLPGYENPGGGNLHLHRWCQWISRFHRGGVYDGEEAKVSDWNRSIPRWLEAELLPRRVAMGDRIVVIAEEWQTAASAIALAEIARTRGWQEQVRVIWNANNSYGFNRIDWERLKASATITTVSRFMKHAMWENGVDPVVIPNGIPSRWLGPVDRESVRALERAWKGRLSLAKIGRWDPNKRWQMAVDAVADLKRLQLRPLLLARGGCEAHGQEVIARAEAGGLRVASVRWTGERVDSVAEAIRPAIENDVILLETYLNEDQRRSLFRAVDAVLANSGIEPFGLVGLETMAVGGVALVGATGEDYATAGYDAISLQTSDPGEIVRNVVRLRDNPNAALQIRIAARRSAAHYTWESIITRNMLPELVQSGRGGIQIAIPPQTSRSGPFVGRTRNGGRMRPELGRIPAEPRAANLVPLAKA